MGVSPLSGSTGNGSLVGTDSSAPYTYSYSNASAGRHNFYASATDDQGATGTSDTLSVTVNARPTVSLSASPSSINEGGSVTVTATASDADGSVVKVIFYHDGTLVGTDTSAPYTYTYANAAARTHSFHAVAETIAGPPPAPTLCLYWSTPGPRSHSAPPPTRSTKLRVSPSRPPPAMPTGASSRSSSIEMAASWPSIRALLTPILIQGPLPGPQLPHRRHRRQSAAATSNTVTVTVNDRPSVTISVSSTAINEGESVTLTATASDTDGSIANVKFYRNGSLVATDPTSPYTYTYSNATAGTRSFYASATDDRGATTTSNTLKVTVNARPTITVSTSSGSVHRGGQVTVTATASDADGSIVKVTFVSRRFAGRPRFHLSIHLHLCKRRRGAPPIPRRRYR